MNANDIKPYLLKPDELDSICELISIQYRYLNGTTLAYPEYFGTLTHLGHLAGRFTNSSYKEWAADFFKVPLEHADIPKMMIVDQYRQFAAGGVDYSDIYWKSSHKWISMWHAFVNGWKWVDAGADQDHWVGPALNCPVLFQSKFKTILDGWAAAPPMAYIDPCTEMDNTMPGHNKAKAAIESWITNDPSVLTIPGSWATKQLAAAKVLQAQPTLDNDEYLFLFFLMFALPAGSDAAKTLATSLSSKSGDTDDFPNDSFINHLFYLVLLHLANPQGTHRRNHGQLCDFLNGMRRALPGTTVIGGVPNLLMIGLDEKLKVLNVDNAYPYAGMPGLARRMSEERVALDVMRAATRA